MKLFSLLLNVAFLAACSAAVSGQRAQEYGRTSKVPTVKPTSAPLVTSTVAPAEVHKVQVSTIKPNAVKVAPAQLKASVQNDTTMKDFPIEKATMVDHPLEAQESQHLAVTGFISQNGSIYEVDDKNGIGEIQSRQAPDYQEFVCTYGSVVIYSDVPCEHVTNIRISQIEEAVPMDQAPGSVVLQENPAEENEANQGTEIVEDSHYNSARRRGSNTYPNRYQNKNKQQQKNRNKNKYRPNNNRGQNRPTNANKNKNRRPNKTSQKRPINANKNKNKRPNKTSQKRPAKPNKNKNKRPNKNVGNRPVKPNKNNNKRPNKNTANRPQKSKKPPKDRPKKSSPSRPINSNNSQQNERPNKNGSSRPLGSTMSPNEPPEKNSEPNTVDPENNDSANSSESQELQQNDTRRWLEVYDDDDEDDDYENYYPNHRKYQAIQPLQFHISHYDYY